ncbi:MAG: response regulator [Myxococcales bacterium]|nr:response regulator [Myxococcales bacterium]
MGAPGERGGIEGLTLHVARRLLDLTAAEIDGLIESTLARVGALFEAGSVALVQTSRDGRVVARSHAWGAGPVSGRARPYAVVQQLASAELVLVGDAAEPDGRAPEVQAVVAADGTRSFAFAAVRAGEALQGGLALRWYAAPTTTTAELLAPLCGLADVLLAGLRRKRGEEALARSEAALRRGQALAHVGSYIFELKGHGPSLWSEEVYRILGREPHDGSLDHAADVIRHVHPDDRAALASAVARAIDERGTLSLEHRVVRPDGGVRDVHSVAEVVCDDLGRPARLFGTLLDITERRRLEAQLLHAQKMEAVGRLAGGVAHDFNNLLTVILGGTASLQLELEEGPLLELVAEIDDAGRRATALTRQLLTFSRRQVPLAVELDLNRVVRDSLRMLSRVIGEDIDLTIALAAEPLPIIADVSQVEQILLNLVVNAREAMPAGGKLTIATGLRAGPTAMLEVRDTGCGIDAATEARMFEPFFTTKPRGQGSGLGLSTVHAVVDGLAGRIEVDSEVGQGTCMRVFLPWRRSPAAAAQTSARPASEVAGHETLLVVEDEDGVRNLVKRVLDGLGYHVIVARTASEALLLCTGVVIDLVLTDVIMPGMSGRELVERLRVIQPDARVLFMSGYTADETTIQAAGPLIAKPFAPAELTARVRELLDAPRGAAGDPRV